VNGWTLLHAAAFEDVADTITSLVFTHGVAVDAVNDFGDTALMIAAQYASLRAVTALLRAGASVNFRSTDDGCTPLHRAAHNLNDTGNACKTIQLLVDAGADINALDNNNFTPLHDSCRAGNRDAESFLLLQYGAKVDLETIDKDTPLHFACTDGGNSTVAAMLVKLGANPYALNNLKESPFHLA
ncbi:ankyrin repeat-containing domain protein, partial [Baffinella frigidus]